MKLGLSFIFTCCLVLLGCASKTAPSIPSSPVYYKISEPIQCVPHARKVSGIPIRGNAHTWWTQAAGRYERSTSIPKVGSVMVLSKTSRLRYGHVAVVKRIIDSRNIEVEHANWGGDRATRAIIYKRMPVKDVSSANDWSRARFWNYPSSTYGSVYPVSGFIYPDPASARTVVASTPRPDIKPSVRPVSQSSSITPVVKPPVKPTTRLGPIY